MENEINQFFSSGNLFAIQLVFWILMFWSFVWKGIALWKAARNTDKT